MKGKRMFSLRYKIMIFAFLMAIVPIAIVGSLSYAISTGLVREQASKLNLGTIKQIANNIEFIIGDVKGISFNLIENDALKAYLRKNDIRSNPNIHNILDDYVLTKNYIYSIYVQDLNGYGLDTQGAVNAFTQAQIDELTQLSGRETWSLTDVTVGQSDLKLISLSRMIRDVNNIGRELGILKINLAQEEIREIYRHILTEDSGLFYIVDNQGIVLSTHEDERIGQPLASRYLEPRIFQQDEGYYDAEIDGSNYLVEFFTIEETGWKLIHYVPIEAITKQGDVIKQVTVVSVCISLVICMFFLFFFMFKVLRPLRQIRILMKSLENEEFNVSIPVQGNDEIALFCSSFNKMSRKLNELFNEVHVVKIKQKEAEIKALEEQINPHFLYNTLDLIYWMGRMEKAFETAEMINVLSKLFRLGLNSGSGFTTVKKELEHIESYMYIQQKRYESVSLTISAEPDALALTVTKLVLQPLVENAITHGLEPRGGIGSIEVRVYRKDGDVIYEVEDDGVGMESARANELLHAPHDNQGGVGLRNIHDRLVLTYGDDYGLDIESEPGKGTKVIVKQIPNQGGEKRV